MILSEHDLAKTERLYAHHRNLSAVARVLRITPAAVSYRLKKAGVELEPRQVDKARGGVAPPLSNLDVKRAVEKHGSQLQASKALGISQPTVSRRLAQADDDGKRYRTRNAIWSPADIYSPEA